MKEKYEVIALKSRRIIKVYDKSFTVDGESQPFCLNSSVPYDMVEMLKDLLDDVYQQGRNDKAQQIRRNLCEE